MRESKDDRNMGKVGQMEEMGKEATRGRREEKQIDRDRVGLKGMEAEIKE